MNRVTFTLNMNWKWQAVRYIPFGYLKFPYLIIMSSMIDHRRINTHGLYLTLEPHQFIFNIHTDMEYVKQGNLMSSEAISRTIDSSQNRK